MEELPCLDIRASSPLMYFSTLTSTSAMLADSCHSRDAGINKIYILNPTVVVKLLQYSGLGSTQGLVFFTQMIYSEVQNG